MKFLTIGYIVWRTGAGKTPSVHLQSLDVKWVQRTGADRNKGCLLDRRQAVPILEPGCYDDLRTTEGRSSYRNLECAVK